MSKRFTGFFELLLLGVVILSIVLGVGWVGNSSAQAVASPQQTGQGGLDAVAPAATTSASAATEGALAASAALTATGPAIDAGQPITLAAVAMPTAIATPVPFDPQTEVDENDAPLLAQAPGTVNVLLLGSDASVDDRYARTDTMIIASVNPDMPSVSMLSLPRDLQVRIPGHSDDRLNIAYELGYIKEYPGGGPAFLAAVLRKNFGIKIDHFVRVDFAGFVKAIDTLGGVDVLVECELHDTFPDKTSSSGQTDLDVYPGTVHLVGKEALWYARSRWSTTDFDRARRQQKVLRAVFSKAKSTNLLQNAIGLYADFRNSVETSVGLGDIPYFVDIATRLDNLSMKNRVLTFPIVRAFTRNDGARVLISTEDTIPYIAEALSPPAGNRATSRPVVEVLNGSSRDDMELVAAERLIWEGFAVSKAQLAPERNFESTQIFDYSVTTKGSPISRLASIFGVRGNNIIAQSDPSSDVVATIVLGEDYNSCPQTSTIAGDVPLAADEAEATPTAAPTAAPEP